MKWLTVLLVSVAVIGTTGAATAATAAPAAPNVCHDTPLPAALAGHQPGDLLAAPQDVTIESGLLPDAGRLYRIAYATMGQNDTVVPSCGLVALPLDRTTVNGIVAWAHGTIGLLAACQPSEKPTGFVGPMPGGIGSPVKPGEFATKKQKDAAQGRGALVGLLRAGYAVTATDYPSQGMGTSDLQSYALGVAEGLSVLDSARVITRNAEAFGLSPIAADAQLPLVTWGHSQGGGSALWAGQLARQYFTNRNDGTLDLVGVAAEAPATQFTTSPGQPEAYMGKHLGDRDIYNFEPGLKLPISIGAVLFSYVTVSWSQVENVTATPAHEFPFGPTAKVNYQDVLTKSGVASAPDVAQCCLKPDDLKEIYGKTFKYLDPNAARFFAAPFAGQKVDGKWQGGIDATCGASSGQPAAFTEWCQWLQFNMPGPYGINPYSKVPLSNASALAPVYLAQGRNDKIIWCVDDSGAVQGANCLSAQYANSINRAYCGGAGSLAVDYFPGVSHFGVPGAAASSPGGDSYAGSPLQAFIDGAMSRALPAGCTTNPNAGTALGSRRVRTIPAVTG